MRRSPQAAGAGSAMFELRVGLVTLASGATAISPCAAGGVQGHQARILAAIIRAAKSIAELGVRQTRWTRRQR